MEFMSKVQAMVISFFGMFGAFIVQLFGPWNTELQTLIIFMAVDFILGLVCAGVFKKSPKTETGALKSFTSFKGLCKKGVMLLIVLVAYQLDKVTNADYIRTAVIIAFITNETISIIENAGIMGIPIPNVITKAIDVLKAKEKDGEDNERH